MNRPPAIAWVLGLAGVLPFLWGAVTLINIPLQIWGAEKLNPAFVGVFVLTSYGTIILAFMSGVLWGFASKGEGALAAQGYVFSVIPALWAFFMVGNDPTTSVIYLMSGFMALLGFDWMFWRAGLAPHWWMQLRVVLTGLVLACLTVGALN